MSDISSSDVEADFKAVLVLLYWAKLVLDVLIQLFICLCSSINHSRTDAKANNVVIT